MNDQRQQHTPGPMLATLDHLVRVAENRCETARSMKGADARRADLAELRAARAAAAELLEASQALNQDARPVNWEDDEESAAAWRKLDAAIAKVTKA